MTKLSKKVVRQSDAIIRDGAKRRRLVVTLYPSGDMVGLRPERTRREELIPLEVIYQLAVRLRVREEQSKKKAAKKARVN